jgi:hypothetical protein
MTSAGISARRTPLPTDAKMIAAARGVQIAGILLCVMDGRNLTKCECFIDLAMAETKERVNRILVAAMSDWTGLKRFGPGSTWLCEPVLTTRPTAQDMRKPPLTSGDTAVWHGDDSPAGLPLPEPHPGGKP